MLHSRTLLFVHSIYNSLHLLIPNSQFIPPLSPSPLPTTNKTDPSYNHMQASLPQHSELLGSHWRELKKIKKRKKTKKLPLHTLKSSKRPKQLVWEMSHYMSQHRPGPKIQQPSCFIGGDLWDPERGNPFVVSHSGRRISASNTVFNRTPKQHYLPWKEFITSQKLFSPAPEQVNQNAVNLCPKTQA